MLGKILRLPQSIIETCFYLLFFAIPFLFTSATSEVFEINKMLATYFLASIIIGSWALKSIFVGKIIFKKTLLDIPLLLFLLSQIISTYFSIDTHMSIWGYYSRLNGGLVSLVVYSLLYWAFVSNMDKEETLKSLKFLVVSATLLSVWAILEKLGYSPSCLLLRGEFNVDCWVQKVQERPFATLGQPNWLASWLVAIAPLFFVRFFPINKNLFIPTLLIVSAIFFTQSDAGYLGLLGAIGILLLQFLPRGKSFKHILLYGLLIVLFISGSVYGYNKYFKDCFSFNFQRNMLEGTSSCQIRSVVWKGALNIWQAHPWVGSGVETFAISFYQFKPQEHNLTSEWNNLYNKAHNEYLNYLATTGVLGLGAYFVLTASSIVLFIKNITKSKLVIGLLAGYVSLLITHFFGFSVVTTNTLLFLYPAIAIALTQNKEKLNYSFSKNKIPFVISVLLITSYLLFFVSNLWLADYLYSESTKFIKRGWYLQSSFKAKEAISLRPNEAIYYDTLAKATSYLAVEEFGKDEGTDIEELIRLTDSSSRLATSLAPYSLSILKSRAIIFNRLSQIDEKYTQEAVEPLEKAIQIAPTEPEAHYSLAVIYSKLDQNQKALDILEKTIQLKPDYYDGRVGLAQTYTKLGQTEKAKEQYQWILDNLNSKDQEIREANEKLK